MGNVTTETNNLTSDEHTAKHSGNPRARNTANKTDSVGPDKALSEKILSRLTWFKENLDWTPFIYELEFLKACWRYDNIAGLWCRQSGKSTTISKYCLEKTYNEPNTNILIIAPSQRQSSLLFQKIKADIDKNPKLLNNTKHFTATEIVWKHNNSMIKALPSGPDGRTIKGFTANVIIVEEAGEMRSYIVNSVLMPMLGTIADGQMIKIGTPHGRNHFYDSCKKDESPYVVIKVPWERAVKEGILQEKKVEESRINMSDQEFMMEWEADFPEEADSYFPWELLQSCMEEYRMIESLT